MCSPINCSAVFETLDENGCILKRVTHKCVRLELGRNEFRDVILKMETGKGAQVIASQYFLRNVKVHGKFVKDGKAGISLSDYKMNVLLSNCPPQLLKNFVQVLQTKTSERNEQTDLANARQRLTSKQPKSYDKISPLANNANRNRENNPNTCNNITNFAPKCSSTPTSSKRKITHDNNQEQLQKRLKAEPQSNAQSLGQPSCLNSEQKNVLNLVLSGKNVFFTGSAGTGKSFLLRKILQVLPPDATFATASTGVAASYIAGTTLHSFAGVGKGDAPIEQWVEMSTKAPSITDNWKKCKHLIIDEISMVAGDYFSKLEKFARIVRKCKMPFGGIQVVLCGDFLQLPPVTRANENKVFCFQTDAWKKAIDVCCELSRVFRQTDEEFISILNSIRIGCCTEEMEARLKKTEKTVIEKDGVVATKLCTHRDSVDSINEEQLEKLPGKAYIFDAADSNPSLSKWIDNLCPVPRRMALKIGTQVMLAKNVDIQRGLVNGARGIITKFSPQPQCLPIVKFTCGIEEPVEFEKWAVRASAGIMSIRRQLPLKLAWAISIHKSQGMTLDCLEMSLSRVFECGQAYVALSRAKSLKGLRIVDFDRKCVRADPQVLRFHSSIQRNTNFVPAMRQLM